MKMRRSHDSLIFIMEISIPGKTVFILRRGLDGYRFWSWWTGVPPTLVVVSTYVHVDGYSLH